MIVYHLTPLQNAASIRWEGLRIDRAIGVPRVWFFTPSKREWARQHIAQHQHCKPDELVEFAYNIPRRWLKRWRRGVWLCYRNVPSTLSLDRRSVSDLLYADCVEDTLIGGCA